MHKRQNCQLDETEYKEFLRWYLETYVKLRKARAGRMDFSYLKEAAELEAGEEFIYVKRGGRKAWLLYGAVDRLYETEGLFLFYDMKEFQAVPKRSFGSSKEAEEWRLAFERKIRELGKMRISFQEILEACGGRHGKGSFVPCRYIRQIEEVEAEYGLLKVSRREMEHRRRLGTFPYRMIGEQMAAAGKNGIVEASERAVVLHSYESITGAFYSKRTLYLAQADGEGIFIPLAALGGLSGAENLMRICDARCRFNNPAFRLRKKGVPFFIKWNIPGKAVLAAGVLMIGTAVCAAVAGTMRDASWRTAGSIMTEPAIGLEPAIGMESGIKMEPESWNGYYGSDTYMTSCLVLMDHAMSDEEIGEKLTEVKKIRNGVFFLECDALAARTPDSRWLGIDCASIQENCTKETARAVSRIFGAEVILYDEFDGDLLMVAYSDADQKRVYQRATAESKRLLETEFQCFGEEQEFPEDLLAYMDITKEEADAIWKGSDAVFQMEKWEEITGHMTKMPVPEEFVGLYDIGALDGRFRVIKR